MNVVKQDRMSSARTKRHPRCLESPKERLPDRATGASRAAWRRRRRTAPDRGSMQHGFPQRLELRRSTVAKVVIEIPLSNLTQHQKRRASGGTRLAPSVKALSAVVKADYASVRTLHCSREVSGPVHIRLPALKRRSDARDEPMDIRERESASPANDAALFGVRYICFGQPSPAETKANGAARGPARSSSSS
jgi:hypothetical protein